MKSSQSRTVKTTTWSKGVTTSNYQPRNIVQPYKYSGPQKYSNINTNTRIINTQSSYIPKAASTTQKYITKTHYQPRNIGMPGKINYSSNIANRSSYQSSNRNSYQPINRNSYQSSNLSSNYDSSKWRNNRGGRTGDTETKVETKQDGDYIIKITTTRKIIDKGDYGYN